MHHGNMIINTLHRMILERGYTIISETENEISTVEALFIITSEKINIAFVKLLITRMIQDDVKNVIVVHTTTITSSARSITQGNSPFKIEFFEASTLVFCILDHVLVPRHVKVLETDSDWKYVNKERYNLPLILKTDPVSRFMGFSSGDVIRIVNDNLITYRITV